MSPPGTAPAVPGRPTRSAVRAARTAARRRRAWRRILVGGMGALLVLAAVLAGGPLADPFSRLSAASRSSTASSPPTGPQPVPPAGPQLTPLTAPVGPAAPLAAYRLYVINHEVGH